MTTIPDITRTEGTPPDIAHLYVPIERIDKGKREIFGRATIEELDAYKTVFSYDGSKRAFSKWMTQFGNIREMHQADRAVGKAVQVQFDDANRQVLVRARVSKSADGDNTWTKIEEGILTGFSVGASQGIWGQIERNGKTYPYLQDYELVELSIVDRPATPGCVIEVARSDGFISEIIEPEDEQPEETREAEPEQTAQETPEETRAGARISHITQDTLHGMRNGHAHNLKDTVALCDCDECKIIASILDPDNDGDIDIVPSLDYDNDGGAGGDGSGDGLMPLRVMRETIARIVQEEITRYTEPVITRMNGIAARLSQIDSNPQRSPDPDITRRLETVDSMKTEVHEVHSLLSEVRGVVAQIAAQPQGGGPVINSALLRNQPQENPSPQQQQPLTPTHASVIADLARNGILDRQQQIDAALAFFKGSL